MGDILKQSEQSIKQIDQFKNKLEKSEPVAVIKDPIRLTPLASKPDKKPTFGRTDSDDVEFVKEITGTDSEKTKASKLGLPETFYLFERGIYLHKNHNVENSNESDEEEDLLARFSRKFDSEPVISY